MSKALVGAACFVAGLGGGIVIERMDSDPANSAGSVTTEVPTSVANPAVATTVAVELVPTTVPGFIKYGEVAICFGGEVEVTVTDQDVFPANQPGHGSGLQAMTRTTGSDFYTGGFRNPDGSADSARSLIFYQQVLEQPKNAPAKAAISNLDETPLGTKMMVGTQCQAL
jgi:hypothetical protein